ncbi:aldehyde reductase 1 [Phlyctema vagabunda]|uniref:Aldehyde reductase 1 n=1 Tax=Phlyctema vagabunda TaxID=108571 RepID=A0ABR4PTH5_9HELO
MARPIPSCTLNNGVKVPLLGFGTFAKGRTAGLSYDAVIAALDAGYRHFDCAWFYNNEDEIGVALKDWLAANPNFTRSDIFITTKVWLHLCGSAEDVAWSLNDSLRKLGTDYVDCFLIHWPICAEKTDQKMPKIGADGKVNLYKSSQNLYRIFRNLFLSTSSTLISRRTPRLSGSSLKSSTNLARQGQSGSQTGPSIDLRNFWLLVRSSLLLTR